MSHSPARSTLRRPSVRSIEPLERRLLLATQTFSNGTAIFIDSDFFPPTPASPYPSNINVPALAGTVEKVTVQLSGFGHDRPEDVDILLVGPGGQNVVLLSDAGSLFAVSGRNLAFEDGFGQVPESNPINSGTFRPTNHDDGLSESWPDAPSPSDGESLSIFNGVDPQGTWRLYVVDDASFMAGVIGGGWSVTITTQDVVGPPAPSTPDLHSSSDSGTSNTDNITNVNTPTFTGTAQPGTTVRLYADGEELASGVATLGGNYSITTSVLSDGAWIIAATASDATGTSAPSAAINITIDTVAPQVSASVFNFETAQDLTYDFSEDVGATLAASDLTVDDLTPGGGNVPTDSMNLSYDSGALRATITFPGFANSILPDANYSATFSVAGVSDIAGNTLSAAAPLNFFSLAGDANRDRKVDITDLGILATNWQQSPRTFSLGNFNYADTVVDITDLGILATNWQKELARPTARAAVGYSTRRVARIVDAIEL
jgi:hypothetical protein